MLLLALLPTISLAPTAAYHKELVSWRAGAAARFAFDLGSSDAVPLKHDDTDAYADVALKRSATKAQPAPTTEAAGYDAGYDAGTAAALSPPRGGPQFRVFYPGYGGRTCFRVPVLLTVNDTLLAFAEARTGNACFNDGCVPLRPVAGDNRTAVVLRISTDSGRSFGPMVDLCADGRGAKGCSDFQAVHDRVRGQLVVQYTEMDTTLEDTPDDGVYNRSHRPHRVMAISSRDGRTWSPAVSLDAALAPVTMGCGAFCNLIVSPGRGLQLRSASHGRRGRLLFCGHKSDPVLNRVSPVWSSDDGEEYALRVVFPRGSVDAAFRSFGPDECSLAELADGTVLYNARNNWWRDATAADMARRGPAFAPWNRSQVSLSRSVA
jgi:hypothetical protein